MTRDYVLIIYLTGPSGISPLRKICISTKELRRTNFISVYIDLIYPN